MGMVSGHCAHGTFQRVPGCWRWLDSSVLWLVNIVGGWAACHVPLWPWCSHFLQHCAWVGLSQGCAFCIHHRKSLAPVASSLHVVAMLYNPLFLLLVCTSLCYCTDKNGRYQKAGCHCLDLEVQMNASRPLSPLSLAAPVQ